MLSTRHASRIATQKMTFIMCNSDYAVVIINLRLDNSHSDWLRRLCSLAIVLRFSLFERLVRVAGRFWD